MRQDEREALRRQFAYRCGYCGVRELDVGAELTIDHFQPSSHGGRHEPENWIYCCHACNEFKGDYWEPGSRCRILHPLNDDLAAHVVELDDGTLQGLSETGTFHILRLRLNRPPLVAHRFERRQLEITRSTQRRILEKLQELDTQVRELTAELEQQDDGGTEL